MPFDAGRTTIPTRGTLPGAIARSLYDHFFSVWQFGFGPAFNGTEDEQKTPKNTGLPLIRKEKRRWVQGLRSAHVWNKNATRILMRVRDPAE